MSMDEDLALKYRADAHFVRATKTFLADEISKNPKLTADDAMESLLVGVSSAFMEIVLLIAPPDLQLRQDAFRDCLEGFNWNVRASFAHLHHQEFDDADDHRKALTAIRKSVGKLYGIVKEMEERA